MSMKRKAVLLIEDNQDHADLIIEEFNRDTEKEIILLKDGQEAIDYIQNAELDSNIRIQPQIDLILLDLNLPNVHGITILRFLKKYSKYHSVPVIILSVISDSTVISEAYENGANGFVTKSISYKNFVEDIRLLEKYWFNTNIIFSQ